MARARARAGHPFDRPRPAHANEAHALLAAYIFEGAWHFDLEWDCDAIWSFFTAGERCVQRTGVQECAGSRRPAADIALKFAAGAISRPAMAGRARGTEFETVDPEVESGRVIILEQCSTTFVRRDLCESGAKNRHRTPYRYRPARQGCDANDQNLLTS